MSQVAYRRETIFKPRCKWDQVGPWTKRSKRSKHKPNISISVDVTIYHSCKHVAAPDQRSARHLANRPESWGAWPQPQTPPNRPRLKLAETGNDEWICFNHVQNHIQNHVPHCSTLNILHLIQSDQSVHNLCHTMCTELKHVVWTMNRHSITIARLKSQIRIQYGNTDTIRYNIIQHDTSITSIRIYSNMLNLFWCMSENVRKCLKSIHVVSFPTCRFSIATCLRVLRAGRRCFHRGPTVGAMPWGPLDKSAWHQMHPDRSCCFYVSMCWNRMKTGWNRWENLGTCGTNGTIRNSMSRNSSETARNNSLNRTQSNLEHLRTF